MKRLSQLLITLALLCISVPVFALDAPVLTTSTSALDVSMSWTAISGATGYMLHYAPNPYTGTDSIVNVDMGTDTSCSATLWDGASYYVAVTASDGSFGGESGYSNVGLFTIDLSAGGFENFAGTFTGNYMSTPFEYIVTQSGNNLIIIRAKPVATGVAYNGTVSGNKAIVETIIYGYYGGYSTWTKINDTTIEAYVNECKPTPYSTCGAPNGVILILNKQP
jgi:hypothetical protein